MTKFFYFKLALNNLRKNRQTYLPFLMASSILIFSMYSFLMIAFNPGFSKVSGGMQFVVILDFGIAVVGLFTAIFLFYANSFLVKRRKKEMGLYAILGMEKRHIARVLRHEMSLTWFASTVVGIGLGILLTRLLFLLIRLALRVDVPLVGTVSWTALWSTTIMFAFLFLLLIGYNSWQVRSVNPIALLRGGQTGEREPKARWLLAILGVAFTGAGYWIAQTVDNPMAALALFFIAVILVIIGTYLLFLTGSIAFLKILRSNKRYYYRSKHFVTVSGMLYRMKQNAAGLASIAILCTMAMITIGTTVALYNGSEKMLAQYYPNDVLITADSATSQADAEAAAQELASQAGVTMTDTASYWGYDTTLGVEDGYIIDPTQKETFGVNDYSSLYYTLLMTNDAYAALEGAPLTLGEGELGCYVSGTALPAALTTEAAHYTLQTIETLAIVPDYNGSSTVNTLLLVASDQAAIADILTACDTRERNRNPEYGIQWNLQGTDAQLNAYYALLDDAPGALQDVGMRVKASVRSEWYAMYGGFLFVGIFLGIIFLMGSAMILYFKQISEGYQDHDRFIILQQVGMSRQEVRGTVRRQILLVFFLPLLVAVCHVAGSLHMMVLMLRIFGLMDVPYIALNTFLSAFGVMVLYGLFYLRTAKTYYKMVKF
ncbi:MAG: ABC transporter permease [Eubacteriales bacterium]|nr:ABC transporter permease [Eubacteriales bacterium]